MRLRPPELDDATWIYRDYGRDGVVTRYLTWRPHRTEEDARTYLAASLAASGATRALRVLERDAVPIGMVDLRQEGFKVSIGYVLAQHAWGQGLMTEAVRAVVETLLADPDIWRVWAVVDVENVASARVLERSGMIREGRLSRWIRHPNLSENPRDVFCYARVRDDRPSIDVQDK